MRRLSRMTFSRFFSGIDRPIARLREVRDSYRALNVEIYGEEMARFLNDW
jgi:hypothetical protein